MNDHSEEIARYIGSEEAVRMLSIIGESDLPATLQLPSLLALSVWAVNHAADYGLDNADAEEALEQLMATALFNPRAAVRILLDASELDPLEEYPLDR